MGFKSTKEIYEAMVSGHTIISKFKYGSNVLVKFNPFGMIVTSGTDVENWRLEGWSFDSPEDWSIYVKPTEPKPALYLWAVQRNNGEWFTPDEFYKDEAHMRESWPDSTFKTVKRLDWSKLEVES